MQQGIMIPIIIAIGAGLKMDLAFSLFITILPTVALS